MPFRDSAFGDALLKPTSGVDRALFKLPKVKWQAWYCLIELKEPIRET